MQLQLLSAVVLGVLLATTVLGQGVKERPIQVEVDAFALVQVPGCNIGRANSLVLPPGVLDDECVISMPRLEPDNPQTFAFTIPRGVEMTAMFSLTVQGGTASMSLWLPGSSVESPPDVVQNELFSSPASSEGWISLQGDTLAQHPGQYILTVSAFSGTPSLHLRVWTPPRVLQLVAEEKRALAQMATACCQNIYKNNSNSIFCSKIAPAALLDESSADWQNDLCHIAPNSCNAQGRLTQLILPGVGLHCPSFPQQLGSLRDLNRLDLSTNNFAGVSVSDVSAVLSSARELQELALGATGITGALSCEMALPKLEVLDVSMNMLEGRLPGCLVNTFRALYVAGNSLGGPLPNFKASSPLRTLYANQQHGLGFTGSIPLSLQTVSGLRHINLGGNQLTGTLPPLPRGLTLLNVSSNQLTGSIRGLPSVIWDVDVSSNDFRGGLPALASYNHLESFVASNNNFTGTIPPLPLNLAHLELVECNLTGPLPRLPLSLRRLDLSDNNLIGEAASINVEHMQVLRIANNSLTGSVPPTAASAPDLFLLDLHANKLTGTLPDTWEAASLQMIMLEDNRLTGTIPASLAGLRNLGILRLGDNRLSGDLSTFAGALQDPEVLAAANKTNQISRLFDFNVTGNSLAGPVPQNLNWLGFFNPVITILVPGPDGSASVAPRVLDLSGNKFEGPWPAWLLKAVPNTASTCSCSLHVNISGPDMHLACPKGILNTTDYSWQLASRLRYTCWDGSRQQNLLDYLVSPANGLDKIDLSMIARGDGGIQPSAVEQKKPIWKSDTAIIAGAVVGGVVGVVLLGLLAYFVVGRRLLSTHKATTFQKFQDDAGAAAGTGAAASSGGATEAEGAGRSNRGNNRDNTM